MSSLSTTPSKLSFVCLTVLLTCGAFAAEPNFEIYNKDKQSITVNVNVENGSLSPETQKAKIEPKGKLQATFSEATKDRVVVTIKISREKEDFIFKVQPGSKSILVTFDSENKSAKLHPQTGPLKGLLGKTVSGLSLKNNLDASAIQVVSEATPGQTKAKDELEHLTADIKKIAIRLKDSSDSFAKMLYEDMLWNESFQDKVRAFVMPDDSNALIEKLLVLHSLDQIKKHFGIVFAGHWERMVSKDWINIREWNAPSADKLQLFAKAFEKELANPLVSSEIILKYLPSNFDHIEKIDKFTKSPDAKKNQPDREIFSSLLANASKTLALEEHLSESLELSKYGEDFKKSPGYPANLIGKVMANILSDSGLSKNIAKGTVFGWNISASFKQDLQKELFSAYLGETGNLDFGQTQLLVNFFQDMKFPVTKGDIMYASELGKYFKAGMAKGLSFSQINVAVRRNLKFDQKTSAEKAPKLATALASIEINTPKVDGDKIFKIIRSRPFYAVGSVLEKFVADLLPEKEKSKASTIRDGLKELDSQASEIKAVSQMRKILDENQVLIISLLPTALNDTALAAQNLIQSALNTINAQIERKSAQSELAQLKDLVNWMVAQAELMKTDPQNSLFFEMPLSLKEQSSLKMGLGQIRLLGALDTFLGKKIIEKILARSEALKNQLSGDSRAKVSKLIAPIAATFAGALPAIVKKFSIEKYLDFLVKVGDFRDTRMTETEFRKEVWKCLKVLAMDLTSVSDTLPRALDVIRDLGNPPGQ